MNIAGQSFAYLTQLGQDNQNSGATGAQDRVAKRAVERAARIEAARASQQQPPQFDSIDFKATFQQKNAQSNEQAASPSKREALGARPEKPPQPGQVVNILV